MKHSYTSEKLIQLIYGECDIFDRLEMEYSIQNDLGLRREYEDIKSSFNALPKVKFSPKNGVMRNILNFSKSSLQAC